MQQLVESIKERGLIHPVILRKKEDDRYESVSGHRRKKACEIAGLTMIKAEVREMTRDEAIIMMVESNLQRSVILPSEKAYSYKMRLEALKRQGERKDLTSDPVGPKSERSNEKLAESVNESVTQIKRYIRLTYLVPELLQYMDEGKIGMRPAVEMSYLDEDTQRDIVDRIIESDDTVFPSHAQTRRIREKAAEGEISYDDVKAIMGEQKPNHVEKVKIPADELRKRIGKNMTDEDFIKYLYSAVDYYKKYLERNRDQGAR
jgi:ParB family chromosome partitioning protein